MQVIERDHSLGLDDAMVKAEINLKGGWREGHQCRSTWVSQLSIMANNSLNRDSGKMLPRSVSPRRVRLSKGGTDGHCRTSTVPL